MVYALVILTRRFQSLFSLVQCESNDERNASLFNFFLDRETFVSSMPPVTRKASSQNLTQKSTAEEQSSLPIFKATTKTKKVGKTISETDQSVANKVISTQQFTREKSPIIKSPPPPKKSKSNNDDLLTKLAAGETSDVTLRHRILQSLEDIGKFFTERQLALSLNIEC